MDAQHGWPTMWLSCPAPLPTTQYRWPTLLARATAPLWARAAQADHRPSKAAGQARAIATPLHTTFVAESGMLNQRRCQEGPHPLKLRWPEGQHGRTLMEGIHNAGGLQSQAAQCARCHGEGVLISPGPNTATAEVCACMRVCLTCRGRRYLFSRDAQGREIARPCACEQNKVHVRLFNEAQVPGKFADARLRDGYRDNANQHAFNAFKLLAHDFKKGNRGILLMGQPGVGKSWLVVAFIHELIFRHGIPVLFRDFFHLLSDLRNGYSQDKPESELIAPLTTVDVLVVDELGKGRNTPWEQNILDTVISQRYNNQKTTLFTSNYTDSRRTTLEERVRGKDVSPLDAEAVSREVLVDRVGPRIHSRLREMCDFVTLTGSDRREAFMGASQ